MTVIRGKQHVQEQYRRAAEKRWVVPTFCAENQTTIEAVLAACQRKAEQLGTRIPITLALTVRYDHRPQAIWYSTTRNWCTGVELFLADCEILARPDGDYPDVDVMLHLDHGQPELDRELLQSTDITRFSSVMFDASAFPWTENLKRTRAFVQAHGDDVLVEGAADEIVDAGGEAHAELTTADRAEEFFTTTGVDMVVSNLGTEHRASAADLQYHPEAARAIAERIGPRQVLHGASSVPRTQLASLFGDGVCKVNIWTTLERDSSPQLVHKILSDISAVIGEDNAEELVTAGLLGPSARIQGRPDISRFTTAWRQEVVHSAMTEIVAGYLDLWYR